MSKKPVFQLEVETDAEEDEATVTIPGKRGFVYVDLRHINESEPQFYEIRGKRYGDNWYENFASIYFAMVWLHNIEECREFEISHDSRTVKVAIEIDEDGEAMDRFFDELERPILSGESAILWLLGKEASSA